MSDAGKSLRTYLLTQPSVTALVGNRIYASDLPQNYKLPAITYHVISKVDEYSLNGALDLATVRVQLDCYGEGRSDAKATAEAVRLACTGYIGEMGADFAQTCHLDTEREETAGPRDSSGRYRHLVSQDWIIAVTESTPT